MPEDTSSPTPGPDRDDETAEHTQPIRPNEPADATAAESPAAESPAPESPAPESPAAESSDPGAPGTPPAEPAVETEPRSRKGRLVAVIAAVVVLVLVAGGAFGAVLYFKHRPHKISTPATAGGMKRDSATEKKYAQQLKLTQAQIEKQVGATKSSKIAVYNQTKASRGAVGPILFFGATLTDKHASDESPTAFIDNKLIKTFTKNKLTVLKVDIGSDGKAVCAEQKAAKTAACVWRTKDSVGELFPINPGWTAKEMSKLMLSVRSDVETQ